MLNGWNRALAATIRHKIQKEKMQTGIRPFRVKQFLRILRVLSIN